MSNTCLHRLMTLLAVSCVLVHAAPQADPRDTPPAEGRPAQRVPPSEAFEACDGKKAGDSVTFTTRRGDRITGICRMIPARLAAVPDHPPGDRDVPPGNVKSGPKPNQ